MGNFDIDEDALLRSIDLDEELNGPNADLELDIDLSELDGSMMIDDEILYHVHRTHYTTKKGEILTCYMTDDIDVAKAFNPDLDEFTSYSYFILPEGAEVKNEKIMDKIEDEEELVEMAEEEIRNSLIEDFNNLYFRAMLTQVY